MKNVMLVGVCVLSLGLAMLVGSCGQVSSSSTTTTIPSSLTISGKLNTGTITNLGIRSSAAAVGYTVVAINNSNNQTYYASADASGNFSLAVAGGASYEVSLIDSNAKYFGPVEMVGNTSSTEVIMGIKPSSNTNLGEIVIDATKSIAKPTSEPTAIANYNDVANATAGIPKGAGTCGKNILVAATREGCDMDKDGIPNLFDADEDGDQIRNGIIRKASAATVVSSTVESVFISSNIWAIHGTTEEAKDGIAMWINVTTPNDAALNQISSVQVIAVPASIQNIATIRVSSSIGSPAGYPAEHSLWKDASYHLYKTTTLGRNQYIVSLCPKAIMNVGDTFTVRVTYTGGSYQDFFLTIPYVMTDWARFYTYNSTTMLTNEGTQNVALSFSTDNLNIVFYKPLDEDGNVLNGLIYSIIVGTVESTAPFSVPTNSTETRLTDSGGSTISATVSTVTAETYYICPVAESADGQRNGEQAWFRKL